MSIYGASDYDVAYDFLLKLHGNFTPSILTIVTILKKIKIHDSEMKINMGEV
jgi:hypothetical protein